MAGTHCVCCLSFTSLLATVTAADENKVTVTAIEITHVMR